MRKIDTNEKLAAQGQRGDAAAREELCRRFAPLVYKTAGRTAITVSYEDAVQNAWLAFLEAIRDYDPAAGVPFAGYAKSCVRYAVWNAHKRQIRRLNREQPLEQPVGEEETLLDLLAASDDPAAEVERKDSLRQVLRIVGELPVRQREALTETVLRGRTLQQAAASLRISYQAVFKLRGRALRRIGREMKI